MYLSGRFQVEPEEAQQIDAFVMSEGGGEWLIGLNCTHIRLGNGQPYLEPTNSSGEAVTELIVSFDGEESRPLGAFGYYGGAYSMPYDSELIMNLSDSRQMTISEPKSGFAVAFALDGFSQAYEKTGCARGKP
jgi:hypothetical protein